MLDSNLWIAQTRAHEFLIVYHITRHDAVQPSSRLAKLIRQSDLRRDHALSLWPPWIVAAILNFPYQDRESLLTAYRYSYKPSRSNSIILAPYALTKVNCYDTE